MLVGTAARPPLGLRWAKGALILPEPYSCHGRVFCLLQSPPMVVPSLRAGAAAPTAGFMALPMRFLTMPAEEEEEESSEEEAGVFQLPWALTAGRFPHSNPCRARGVAHPLARLGVIQQLT